MQDPTNISDVVSSFYSELQTVAAELNAASDELGKSIAEIDAVLKNLNLGITVWTAIQSGHGDLDRGDELYWSDDIGYAKCSGRWGICLRQVAEDLGNGIDKNETWLFNDAPRALRLVAIDHIVSLLQKLTEEGQSTTQKIREKLADVQEVATAVSQASQVRATHLAKARTTSGKLYQAMKDVPLGGIR
jgi:hypothetical protein